MSMGRSMPTPAYGVMAVPACMRLVAKSPLRVVGMSPIVAGIHVDSLTSTDGDGSSGPAYRWPRCGSSPQYRPAESPSDVFERAAERVVVLVIIWRVQVYAGSS